MTTYSTAIAATKAGTARTKFLFVGDSYVEGEGASARLNRWSDLVISRERTRFSIGGSGVGLTSRYYATYLTDSSSWRTPGSTTGTVNNASYFWPQGYRGSEIAASGSVTWTVTGDSFDVVYLQAGTGGGTGSLKVFIDGSGTAQTTINTASGSYAPGTIYHGSLGTAGSHTVKVTATTATVAVDGVVAYNGDYTAGLTYWDCSHTNFDNDDFQAGTPTTDYQSAWTRLLPHIVVDDLMGGNEYNNSSMTPTAMASLITTRISTYKALSSSPTIVFVVNWVAPSMGAAGANGLGYTYAQYCTAAINAVNTAGGCTILDLRSVYPTAASNPTWFASDSLHPSNTGHGKIADAVETTLATLAPSGTAGAVTAARSTATGSSYVPTVVGKRKGTALPPLATANGSGKIPTVLGKRLANVTAATSSATASAYTPSVIGKRSAIVSAAVATGSAVEYVPTVIGRITATVAAGFSTASALAPVPSVSGSALVHGVTATATATASSPLVVGYIASQVLAATANGSATARAPIISAARAANVTATLATATGNFPVPTVAGSGTSNVGAVPMLSTAALHAPSVFAGRVATVTAAVAMAQGYGLAPNISAGIAGRVQPITMLAHGNAFAPGVSAGGPMVLAVTMIANATLIQPSISVVPHVHRVIKLSDTYPAVYYIGDVRAPVLVSKRTSILACH